MAVPAEHDLSGEGAPPGAHGNQTGATLGCDAVDLQRRNPWHDLHDNFEPKPLESLLLLPDPWLDETREHRVEGLVAVYSKCMTEDRCLRAERPEKCEPVDELVG